MGEPSYHASVSKRPFRNGVIVGGLVGWLLTFAWFRLPGELTVHSTPSPDGTYMAQIEARGFNELGVFVSITVRRAEDGKLVLKELLTTRDLFQDASVIRSVMWESPEKVVVQMDAPNFQGRKEFNIPK